MTLDWLILFVIASLILSMHWGVAFFIVALSASIRLLGSRVNSFWQMSLDSAAAQAFCAVLLTVALVKLCHRRVFEWVFVVLGVYTSILILSGFPLTGPFYMNLSMSGCFCACVAPLVWSKKSKIKYLAIILLLAAIYTQQSQPIALTFVAIFAYLFAEKKIRFWQLPGLAILLVGAEHVFSRHSLFDTNGRLEAWQMCMQWWWVQKAHWLGVGLGSFSQIGPVLTKKHSLGTYFWLHSDWLQAIFELGWVGFVAILGLCGVTLVRLYRTSSHLFAGFVAFCAWGLANMPLHFAASALLGAYFVVTAEKLLPGQVWCVRNPYKKG